MRAAVQIRRDDRLLLVYLPLYVIGGRSLKARVYIAGPYSQGDVAINVRNAYLAANQLADLGFAPFVPHATHFWHMMFPREYEFWLDLDNQFLPFCEALLRLPGASSGADKEVDLARSLGIPVFSDIREITDHFNRKVTAEGIQ